MKNVLLCIMVLIVATCLVAGCGELRGFGEGSSGISVGINEKFVMVLDSDPTAGYSWHENHDPMMLELVGRTYRKGEHAKPELAGSTGGVEYFTFKALRTGEAKIIMTYERPWEEETIKQVVFTVNIQ